MPDVDVTVVDSNLERLAAAAAHFPTARTAMDLDEVLDVILASALDMLRASAGSVMLLEGEDALRVVAVRGLPGGAE